MMDSDLALTTVTSVLSHCSSNDAGLMNGIETGGSERMMAAMNINDNVDGAGSLACETATTNGVTNNPKDSYDDLFPSLPPTDSLGGSTNSGKTVIGDWNRKPRLVSSTVTELFNICVEERRGSENLTSSGISTFGGDDANRKIRLVMQKTDAKIEMASSKNQSLTFLITGKQENVSKARRELTAHFQTVASSTVSIPKEHYRFILGPRGARLNALQLETTTKITVPGLNDPSEEITVSGPRKGIEKAIRTIQQISQEQSKQTSTVLQVPKEFHPWISGLNGENVNQLMAEFDSKIKIHIPPASVNKDELTISGEKEAVQAAANKIEAIWKDVEMSCTSMSINVKKPQHKYVIGPKGCRINEIFAQTGILVEVPSQDDESEFIKLRGPQDRIASGLKMVMEKSNSIMEKECFCPEWLHKYIIGRKGVNIQKITSDFPKVHVDISAGTDRICLSGPPSDVSSALIVLQSQVNDLSKTMTFEEISTDAKYQKHIIGKNGSNVRNIQESFDVTLAINEGEEGFITIRLEGEKERVALAKKSVEEMISKVRNEISLDMNLENRFHGHLIGYKGESIQKIRLDFPSVLIHLPKVGEGSDIVTLRGPRDQVGLCSEHIQRIYNEFLENNFQAKVLIFRQFHKFIIGKGGSNLKQIQQETETRIEVPDKVSSDIIVVTGRQENVKIACKKIQAIQSTMAEIVTAEMAVSSEFLEKLRSLGSEYLSTISDECGGVRVQLPPSSKSVSSSAGNNSQRTLSLRGPKSDVDNCKRLLAKLIADRNFCSETRIIQAKMEHHKALIGRNGSNIQEIRDKSGARIVFAGETIGEKLESITIIGTKIQVDRAEKLLNARIKDLDAIVEDTVEVLPCYHRHFFAKRGEAIKNIEDELSEPVSISFPKIDSDSSQVTIRGSSNAVKEAKAKIQAIVENLVNQVTQSITINQSDQKKLVTSRGQRIEMICAEFNVVINFPDRNSESEIVNIVGQPKNCEKAAQALLNAIPITEEVLIPYEFHRYIIGVRGAGIQSLSGKYDVIIKIPPVDRKSDTICVTGPAENVKSAIEALQEKLTELEAEKADREAKKFKLRVTIAAKYHPKIIGRNGSVINQLRNAHDVNIQLPNKRIEENEPSSVQTDSEQDIITIIGYEKNALAAKAALEELISNLENMSSIEVMLNPGCFPGLIGRKGAGIRKIMTQYKVDITLPKEGDQQQAVIISGDEENILDCKEHLLNIEDDFLRDLQERQWSNDYIRSSSNDMNKDHFSASIFDYIGNQQSSMPNSFGDNGNFSQGNEHRSSFQISQGAPWQGASNEAFPVLGGFTANDTSGSSLPAWGPRRAI